MEETVILDGGLKYSGKLLNGIPHGYGKLTWQNGDYYEGNFKFGKRNGQGKRVNVDGSEYSGDYIDDKPHGRGKMLFRFRIQAYIFGRMAKDTKENGKKVNFMGKG